MQKLSHVKFLAKFSVRFTKFIALIGALLYQGLPILCVPPYLRGRYGSQSLYSAPLNFLHLKNLLQDKRSYANNCEFQKYPPQLTKVIRSDG